MSVIPTTLAMTALAMAYRAVQQHVPTPLVLTNVAAQVDLLSRKMALRALLVSSIIPNDFSSDITDIICV